MLIPLKITAIVPTFNEENNIEKAISCLDFADEIIVIDSYSTDRTVSICEKLDVKVFQREFDDFSSQKNYAIDLARHNWVFVLDADERISSELSKEIVSIIKNPKEFVAFNIYRTFYFEGRKVAYGGWQTDKVIRLFRKEHCRYNGMPVHERIKSDGKTGFLKNRLDHFSYQSRKQYEGKLKFYASLQAKELMKQQKKISTLHHTIKPVFRFVVLYFVRLGFLDGKPGLILAQIHAKGVLQRYQEYDQLKEQMASTN